MLKDIREDLRFLRDRFNVNPLVAVLTNRGFHALLFYRLSNALYRFRIPLISLILTRIIQILYAIDIDYKAKLKGGIVIIHGVGIVIGEGALVSSNTIIYHGVTLGRKKQVREITDDDGFPVVGFSCVIGAGAKLIGPINIGSNCLIGPNVVLTKNVPDNAVVKCIDPVITIK